MGNTDELVYSHRSTAFYITVIRSPNELKNKTVCVEEFVLKTLGYLFTNTPKSF